MGYDGAGGAGATRSGGTASDEGGPKPPPGARGMPRGGAGAFPVVCPQDGQNAAVSATCVPHFEQNIRPPCS
ncbi:MAG: hypothetical protein WBE21_08070, partial [Candidatus Acidiferrales bacterium]